MMSRKITKFDLIDYAYNKTECLTKQDISDTLEAFTSEIKSRLSQDKAIELRGFGTFYSATRKPRPARNPRNGDRYEIGSRRVALFRFGEALKRSICQSNKALWLDSVQ